MRAGEYLSELLGGVLNVVYPPLCLLCESDIDGVSMVCAPCLSGLERITRHACHRCGAPAGEARNSCVCHNLPDHLDIVRSSALYSGRAKDIVHLLKFGGYWGLTSVISGLMENDARSVVTGMERDFVVMGVPLHRVRQRERGYDQARMLASVLSARLGLDYVHDALRRRKNSRPQAQLSLEERLQNMRGAFKVTDPSRVRGRSVLLVDDVITTGTTLGSCSTVLTEAGAERVLAVSFARRMLIEQVS